jgi:hypothetical protein
LFRLVWGFYNAKVESAPLSMSESPRPPAAPVNRI